MIFRIYHETLSGHVYMRVFAGKHEGDLGKCGDLCMRVEEYEEFRGRTEAEFQPEVRPDTTRSAHDKNGRLIK